MTSAYTDPRVTLYLGDCLEVLPTLEADSVDSIVTDPPYGISFMGRVWDHGVPATPFWAEMFRVLKPGGHLLSFGGTRTIHRIMTNIEDAGFEIRDTLMWIYASGFPKSLDVSKALDKVAGAEREATGVRTYADGTTGHWSPSAKYAQDEWSQGRRPTMDTAPATDLARKWEGWGTALKPAHEPIVMARKPLIGTVAQTVTRYGTGALNIDACRIGPVVDNRRPKSATAENAFPHSDDSWRSHVTEGGQIGKRWPSNVLLDADSVELFDEPNPGVVGSGATSESASGTQKYQRAETSAWKHRGGSFTPGREWEAEGYGDSGGYSRFFKIPTKETNSDDARIARAAGRGTQSPAGEAEHADLPSEGTGGRGEVADRVDSSTRSAHPSAFLIPKADRAERERGLAGAPTSDHDFLHGGLPDPRMDRQQVRTPRANTHPTVKPLDLMRHLVRLVTPPGGTCLDPFAGSGSTLLAASEEGFKCIGIEREADYCEIIKGRLMATPMGLGLDVPAPVRRQAKDDPRGSKRAKSYTRKGIYEGGWAPGFLSDDPEEEPAA